MKDCPLLSGSHQPQDGDENPRRSDPQFFRQRIVASDGEVCSEFNIGVCSVRADFERSTNARSVKAVLMACSPADRQRGKQPTMPQRSSTPLNAATFQLYLRDHPDPEYIRLIVSIITEGANLEYTGPICRRLTPNSLSAQVYHDILSKSISKEISLNHTFRPFNYPPFKNFVVNALGVRPKKTGGHRIIMA